LEVEGDPAQVVEEPGTVEVELDVRWVTKWAAAEDSSVIGHGEGLVVNVVLRPNCRFAMSWLNELKWLLDEGRAIAGTRRVEGCKKRVYIETLR
jgi:hypothetical protein